MVNVKFAVLRKRKTLINPAFASLLLNSRRPSKNETCQTGHHRSLQVDLPGYLTLGESRDPIEASYSPRGDKRSPLYRKHILTLVL